MNDRQNRPDTESGFWPPRDKGESVPGAGVFAMRIFIASLSCAFFSLIALYFVLRAQAPEWPPPDAPPLPVSLWVSTALILACSVSIQLALGSVRADEHRQARIGLVVTFVLGVLFMVSQARGWHALRGLHDIDHVRPFVITFFLLTGLHALHMVGGLFLQAFVTLRAFQGRYWSLYHPGVRYSAMYWHFLDAMWILLFVVLVLGS